MTALKCTCDCKDSKTARHQNEKVKTQDDSKCIWWINSAKHGFYFWSYLRSMSGPDGSMPIRTQTELAKLMGWSSTRTYFEMKEAMDELKVVMMANSAKFLFNEEGNIEFTGMNPNVKIDDSFD